ncbi:MAG: cyclopropane-fatty-acyl-phospholipid synthase family protein [Actinomycetes bacterium]
MKLANLFELIAGERPDLEFQAFDGSRAGNPDADVQINLRSERALQYLASSPGELGLARAYVAGEIDIEGSLHGALSRLGDVGKRQFTPTEKFQIGRTLLPYYRRRIEVPPEEVNLAGDRHTKRRDAASISHHYDVSNKFYSWVLGPSMAYTCAVYSHADASLEEAQAEKFDLVCRKLDLQPGQRLLDVGCGWGGMVRHAVENYGVRAIGVTLSAQQAGWGQQVIIERGISDRAEIRHGDYRDITESDFDAVSSIGLTEHIGKANYRFYFSFLRDRLRYEGRLLNHSITRPNDLGQTLYPDGFINRYVFPDGELTGPGHLLSVMSNQGLEGRHQENLREHYALTLAAWAANLDAHWDQAVAEVGPGKARVWRLYLVASQVAFEANRIQLHQFLAVKAAPSGKSGMPLRLQLEQQRDLSP